MKIVFDIKLHEQIIAALRNAPFGLTRPQICEVLGLWGENKRHERRTTIYDHLVHLMRDGFVREVILHNHKRGRPVTLFQWRESGA